MIGNKLVLELFDEDFLASLVQDKRTDKTLLEMAEYIANKEQTMQKHSQVSVMDAADLVVRQYIPVSGQRKCKQCCGKSHGADNMHVRKAKCPAWDYKCPKCQGRGHYKGACYKCSTCGKWGHKSKYSTWCRVDIEDEQDTEPEPDTIISAMTVQQQRKGKKKTPVPKQELCQVPSTRKFRRQAENTRNL